MQASAGNNNIRPWSVSPPTPCFGVPCGSLGRDHQRSRARRVRTNERTAPEASQRTAPSMTRDGLSRSEAETKESSGRAAIWPRREPRGLSRRGHGQQQIVGKVAREAARRDHQRHAEHDDLRQRQRNDSFRHPLRRQDIPPPIVRPRRARSMKTNGPTAGGEAADKSRRASIARHAGRGRLSEA